MDSKATIREQALKKKEQIDITSKSKEIKRNLQTLPEYQKAESVMSYVSKGNEIDTHNLLQEMLENKKKVFVPFIKENIIKVSELKSLNELVKGNWGVPEPAEPVETTHTADIVIVPGLAFDSGGNRIGFGKGYYDRFLAQYKALKIALTPEEQIMQELPCESHDIPVDIIVTEERIIRCNNVC